jgi:hypothetical protein
MTLRCCNSARHGYGDIEILPFPLDRLSLELVPNAADSTEDELRMTLQPPINQYRLLPHPDKGAH